jgi:hypothetical protein
VTLGAEPKKIAYLVAIVVVGGGISLYENGVFDPPAPPPQTKIQSHPAPVLPAPAALPARGRGLAAKKAKSGRKDGGAWTPRLGVQNPEDRPDPATIDPTLHFELVAKVQSLEAGNAGRNLFAYGAPPPPPAPKVDIPKNVAKIPINQPPPPPSMPTGPVGPPQPAPAPQMTFKYYGFKESVGDHRKAAFLLDGDAILVTGENDIFLKRYRVVRIERDQITIEDTQFKSTQTIKVQENIAG